MKEDQQHGLRRAVEAESAIRLRVFDLIIEQADKGKQ